MKKLFLLLILLSAPILLFSAPFGLSMGMTLDDLTEACDGADLEHIEDDCYYVFPVKKHPLFKHYLAFVDDDEISTNDYGTEIQNAFSEIKERISKTYGHPRMIDEIASDTLWKASIT